MVANEENPIEAVVALENKLLAHASRLTLVQAYTALSRLTTLQGLDPMHNIRLRPALTMEMARSEIESIEKAVLGDGTPIYFVNTNILGLYGQRSPLPKFVTEDISADSADDTLGMKFFLDLIHQRLHQLLYRSRISKKPNYSREGLEANQRTLFTMIGMREASRQEASKRSSHALLRHLNIFRHQRGTSVGLTALFGSLFDSEEVKLVEHQQRWVRLHHRERLSLGVAGHQIGFNSLIGKGLVDSHGLVTISAGKLTKKTYKKWLKSESDWQDLKMVTRKFLNQIISVKLEYEIDRVAVFDKLDNREAPQLVLGRNAWLLGSHDNNSTLKACVTLL
ncbi:MAG: type VI secretion system baseplate subunit TssG [OM182 bacterium]|nr:type VI secretion system baseplate subunit TssG [OM182 bacterium]